jgi:hypothetical protein
MSRLRQPGLIPVIVVAIAALVLGSLGTAVAGDSVATITKKTVKKIANRQIAKQAPSLSVAKAKVADTATTANTAITANTATTASTATSAASAATAGDVDGYSASDLARATTTVIDVVGPFDHASFTEVVSTTIQAPKAGVLVISGQSRVNKSGLVMGGTSVVQARATVDGTKATASSVTRSSLEATTDTTVYVTGAYPVTAGSHVVRLEATNGASTAAFLSEASVTVLFVPFGATGAPGEPQGPTASAPRGLNR